MPWLRALLHSFQAPPRARSSTLQKSDWKHHLGLTCDPVNGMVQIPCIERNVFAAARALTCSRYAGATDGSHRFSFAEVVAVMIQTKHDLPSLYRETASGGLATTYHFPPK